MRNVKGTVPSVIRQCMDVRVAPAWLRRATDAWLAVLMAAIIGLYLLH